MSCTTNGAFSPRVGPFYPHEALLVEGFWGWSSPALHMMPKKQKPLRVN